MRDHGYECRKCGHVPTEKELQSGVCPGCQPMDRTKLEIMKENSDLCLEVERLTKRLAQYDGAADYDRERDSPASPEAHDIWDLVTEKPHFALPIIQAVLVERDTALREVARLQVEVARLLRERRDAHTPACNYSYGPMFGPGCICVVTYRKHMNELESAEIERDLLRERLEGKR